MRSGPPSYEQLEPVPTDTLARAVAICWRYRPADGGPMGDGDIEDQYDEIGALADKEGVDSSALGTRADKLAELLTTPAGRALYAIEDEGLVVDEGLLEFAATSDVDDSIDPLSWPPSSEA